MTNLSKFWQTWSITYHSWLTFFLLLGAIILWMVPNQRQSMLRLSPFLTAYAIFLLVTQYLFDLDFTNEELIKTRINITEGEQIGFSKSDFPVKELGIKVRTDLLMTRCISASVLIIWDIVFL